MTGCAPAFRSPRRPGTRYEYSNYAFGLLGRVVTKASGMPYEQYMQREILSKLRMDATTFEFADVPAGEPSGRLPAEAGRHLREEPPCRTACSDPWADC